MPSPESLPNINNYSATLVSPRQKQNGWRTLADGYPKSDHPPTSPALPHHSKLRHTRGQHENHCSSELKISKPGLSCKSGKMSPRTPVDVHPTEVSRHLSPSKPLPSDARGKKGPRWRKRGWSIKESRKNDESDDVHPDIRISQQRNQSPSRSQSRMYFAGNDSTNHSYQSADITKDSLLHVEIPKVELERFSVMFAGLLQANPTCSSSLLARRQGFAAESKVSTEKKGKVRWLNMFLKSKDWLAHTPQMDRLRVKTSSDTTLKSPLVFPAKSPSFSLFPPASPQWNKAATKGNKSEKSPLSKQSVPPTRTPPIAHFPQSGEIKLDRPTAPEDSNTNLILDLNSSRSSSFDAENPFNFSASSAEREVLRKTSQANESSPSQSTQSHQRNLAPTPARLSRLAQSPVSPDFEAVKYLPGISIARQVSVSKQQVHLVIPSMSKKPQKPVLPRLIDG